MIKTETCICDEAPFYNNKEMLIKESKNIDNFTPNTCDICCGSKMNKENSILKCMLCGYTFERK